MMTFLHDWKQYNWLSCIYFEEISRCIWIVMSLWGSVSERSVSGAMVNRINSLMFKLAQAPQHPIEQRCRIVGKKYQVKRKIPRLLQPRVQWPSPDCVPWFLRVKSSCLHTRQLTVHTWIMNRIRTMIMEHFLILAKSFCNHGKV